MMVMLGKRRQPMSVAQTTEKTRILLNSQLDAVKTQTERNQLGQFATPFALALEIVEFAQKLLPANLKIRFLDPAFGTGAFYSALLQHFSFSQIVSAVGYEIDPHYGREATKLWSHAPLQLNIADFTQVLPPREHQEKANLVLCNPPYVRHHHLSKAEKQRLQRTTEQVVGIKLSGLAGLYCHFLCQGNAWMQEGGLAGWLIPSGFMDVNYGQPIKEYLLTRVTLLRVHRFNPADIQFDDALVSSAVIWLKKEKPPANHAIKFTYGGTLTAPQMSQTVSVAKLSSSTKWTKFGSGPSKSHPNSNSHLDERQNSQLCGKEDNSSTRNVFQSNENGYKAIQLDLFKQAFKEKQPLAKHHNKLQQSNATLSPVEARLENHCFNNEALKLKDLFTIKRGLATGANHFFILTPQQVAHYQLPSQFLQPILPSSRYLTVDEIEADSSGNPLIERQLFLLKCHLAEEDVQAKYPSLWQYFQWGEETGISDHYLCRHRHPWYAQENRSPSPLLCTYMGRSNASRSNPFRFILNHSMATAPNVYLMLYPKPLIEQALSSQPQLLKQVWQVLNQISPETLIGESRVYGGGLHKLEPNELGLAPADEIGQIFQDLYLSFIS